MRLTIIPADGAVYVNGVAYMNLDLATCDIPNDVHALQWYDTYGELEFKRSFVDGQIIHPANSVIAELPVWATACTTKWDEAKVAEETALAEAIAYAEANPIQTAGTQEF